MPALSPAAHEEGERLARDSRISADGSAPVRRARPAGRTGLRQLGGSAPDHLVCVAVSTRMSCTGKLSSPLAGSVRAIVKSVDIPVQLGGGIRSLEQIRQWLEEGINRVILGTIAVEDPALVIEACRYYPGQIAVGIDARGGKVAIQGWVEDSEVKATELAKRFEDIGVSCIIYTDIERDGTGIGPNIDATIALARATSIPIIASGGVGSLQDLTRLRDAEHEGIDGVIIGKALYEKKFTPAEALKTVAPLQTEIIS